LKLDNENLFNERDESLIFGLLDDGVMMDLIAESVYGVSAEQLRAKLIARGWRYLGS